MGGVGPLMIFFFFFSRLDQSCLQTSFAVGFIHCSSGISPLASCLMWLSVKTSQWTWRVRICPCTDCFFFSPLCPSPLVWPYHSDSVFSSPCSDSFTHLSSLPSVPRPLKLGAKQFVHPDLRAALVFCAPGNGRAWPCLSSSVPFNSTDTAVFLCSVWRIPCLWTAKRKRKLPCYLSNPGYCLQLEKVAEQRLLCALMLTKLHEICLEIRMGVNTSTI